MKKMEDTIPATVNSETKPTRLPEFGPPPLIPGEDEAAYDALFVQISKAVKPRDFLEQMWVHDTVDLFWGVLRYRRLKAKLLNVRAHEGLRKLSFDHGIPVRQQTVQAWARRDADAVKEVNEMFEKGVTSEDSIMAETLANNIDDIERIEPLMTSGELRRDKILREIERHRKSLVRSRGRTKEQTVDGEFEVISENADVDSPKIAA